MDSNKKHAPRIEFDPADAFKANEVELLRWIMDEGHPQSIYLYLNPFDIKAIEFLQTEVLTNEALFIKLRTIIRISFKNDRDPEKFSIETAFKYPDQNIRARNQFGVFTFVKV
jgi:hypothetical protein